ncbi:MAG TPA: 4Fe-4S dicluster domain-containing protein [Longimicrobiales bacterium]
MGRRTRSGARLPRDDERLRLLARGLVVAEPGRCVECGLCAYNCPMGVDTRKYARAGLPVTDAACILCGSCVVHCPRGTLRLAVPDEREAEDSVNVQQATGWRAA